MDIPHTSRRTPDLLLRVAPPAGFSYPAYNRFFTLPESHLGRHSFKNFTVPLGARSGQVGASRELFHWTWPEALPKWKVAGSQIQSRPSGASEKVSGARARGQRRAGQKRGTKGACGPGRMLCSPAPHPASSRALPLPQVARPWVLQEGVFERGTQRLTSARPGTQTPLPDTHSSFIFLHPCCLQRPACPLCAKRGARRSPCR